MGKNIGKWENIFTGRNSVTILGRSSQGHSIQDSVLYGTNIQMPLKTVRKAFHIHTHTFFFKQHNFFHHLFVNP